MIQRSYSGYALLRIPPSSYAGIDREPLVRQVPADGNWTGFQLFLWGAFDLFSVPTDESVCDSFLLRDPEACRLVLEQVSGYCQPLYCQVFEHPPETFRPDRPFLGFDLAYPGGNFYSAVCNGLHPPHPSFELQQRYGSLLNAHGLFSNVEPLHTYEKAFRQEVATEANSIFWTFALFEAPEV